MGRKALKVDVTCKQCAAIVQLPPSRAKGFRYCSLACRRKAKSVTMACEMCGKVVEGWKCSVTGRRFCSNDCKAAWQRSVPDFWNRRVATTKVIQPCKYCGKPFESWAANERIYCSVRCWGAMRRAQGLAAGANSPRFLGLFGSTHAIHLEARRLLGNRGMICGWDEASCDVAHIIARSKGGESTLENLAILCPNHHRLFDFGLLSIEQLRAARHQSTPAASSSA